MPDHLRFATERLADVGERFQGDSCIIGLVLTWG